MNQPLTAQEKLVRNGWPLLKSNPDFRKTSVTDTLMRHPGHVVVIVLGMEEHECVKFLVAGSVSLEKFIQQVGLTFGYKFDFHVIFDGISYPTDNLMQSIAQRITRDDCILYGRVVRVDPQHQLSTSASTSSILA